MKQLFILLFTIFAPHLPCLAQQSLEDSLKKVIADHKDDNEVITAYNVLASEYIRKDLVKAKAYTGLAITLAQKTNNLKKLSSSYVNFANIFYQTGKTDSAEYYINEVRNIYEKAAGAEKDVIGANYYASAALHCKRTGDYQKAIPLFEKAIIYNIKTGQQESIAGQYLNLGNTYSILGNYRKATEQHLKALRIFEGIGNERGISFCYHSLSISFTELKQYSKALLYTNKSLAIKTAENDKRGLGTVQSSFGHIYFSMGELDKSLAHYNISLDIARELKLFPSEKSNYYNMAKVYKAKNDFKQAVYYYNQCKLLALQLKDTSTVAEIEADLIVMQTTSKSTALAENKLKSTIALFKERGDMDREASGYKNMADFYIANKEYDKALEYDNKYYQVVDSIENNDLQMQVKKMEELYTVEKKEKEITLLKKEQELTQASLQKQKIFQYGAFVLSGLLLLSGFLLFNRYKLRQKMKQLVLRNQIAADLHDEVGSSLSSIHMLSQMATQQGNATTHKDILERMSNNAKETMDKMGDIVWMIKPGETEAGSLKQRIERFAYETGSAKNIDMLLNLQALETARLSVEQRKNTWLIFKESLNNAVEYSGSLKIEITATLQNKSLLLQVKDFGKGFDTNAIKKGNGLDNMQQRAKDLLATLTIESSTNKGTTIRLIVPL